MKTSTEENEIMSKLSRVENLLTKCYINENVYESMNILQEILFNLDDSLQNFHKLHIVLKKTIEIFVKYDNRSRECILFILQKYKKLFNNAPIYQSQNKNNEINICSLSSDNCLKLLNSNDHIAKRQCLQLLKLLPFLIDIKIKDTILFMLTDDSLTQEEKNDIREMKLEINS